MITDYLLIYTYYKDEAGETTATHLIEVENTANPQRKALEFLEREFGVLTEDLQNKILSAEIYRVDRRQTLDLKAWRILGSKPEKL